MMVLMMAMRQCNTDISGIVLVCIAYGRVASVIIINLSGTPRRRRRPCDGFVCFVFLLSLALFYQQNLNSSKISIHIFEY